MSRVIKVVILSFLAFYILVAPGLSSLAADKEESKYPLELYRTLSLGQGMWGIAWSPDSKKIAATYEMAGQAAIWDVESGKQIQNLKWLAGSGPDIYFLPDNKTLLSKFSSTVKPFPSGPYALSLWDTEKGEVIKSIKGPFPDSPTAHYNLPHAIAMTPDGSIAVANGNVDKSLVIYSVSDEKILHVLDWPSPLPNGKAYNDSPICVALSGNGKLLAVGGVSGWVYIYDLRTAKLLRTIRSYFSKDNPWVNDLAFSPDSKFLATGISTMIENADMKRSLMSTSEFLAQEAEDYRILNVWDVESGALISSYPAIKGIIAVDKLSWSPDGRSLAFITADRYARLWFLDKPNDPGVKLDFTKTSLTAASIAPNGKYLAIAAEDLLIFELPKIKE